MADWYYKSNEQEHGPYGFDVIVQLVGDGSLTRRDQLRQGEDGNWVDASSVVGLFPELEEVSELSDLEFTFEDPSSSSPDRVETVATDLGEFELVSATEPMPSAGQQAPTAVAESTGLSDAWYYRSLGQELGPMPLAKMVSLAVDGTIAADDDVRNGETGNWTSAAEVEFLAPILAAAQAPVAPPPQAQQSTATPPPAPPEEAKAASETTSRGKSSRKKKQAPPADEAPRPAEGADLRDDEPEPAAASAAAKPASPPEPEPETTDDRWFCRVDGVEHGPLSFDELTAMVRHGRIEQGHQVKTGAAGAWVPAASVSGLFTPASTPTPAAAPPVPSGGSPSFATGGSTPYTRPKTAPKPKKPKRVRGPREPLMPKLKEQIASNWKVLAGAGGVLLIVGIIILFGSGIFGSGHDAQLKELDSLVQRHKELKNAKSSADKWQPLVADAEAFRQRVVPDLEKTASAKNPLGQQLLWAIRDHLVQLLKLHADGQTGDSGGIDHEAELNNHLENAKKLAGGGSLDGG